MKYIAILAFGLFVAVARGQSNDQAEQKSAPAPDGLKALKHPDAGVRYQAAALLVRLGPVGKIAVPELRETLKDVNGFVRVKAAEALWTIEKTSPSVLLPVLLRALKDSDASLRAAAAPVLGKMGSSAKKAVPALIVALQDKDESVRLEVIAALGDIGPAAKNAAPALLNSIRDDDTILEPFVAAALGNMGSGVVDLLGKALTDPMVHRRRTAAEALSLMGPDASLASKAVVASLGDADTVVRIQVAKTLGLIGADANRSVPRLEAALNSPMVSLRIEAALALWRIEKKARYLPMLLKALNDPAVSVRADACRALGCIGPDANDAVPALAKVLRDKDSFVRHCAAEALGNIGPAAAASVASLRMLLADDDTMVRLTTALALWRVTGEVTPSLDVLRGGLKSKVREVRRYAAVLLKNMGKTAQAAVPDLVDCIQDDDAAVRAAAKEALKEINQRAARQAGVR